MVIKKILELLVYDMVRKCMKHYLPMKNVKKAVDMGKFYRMPADNRGLNYDKYFTEGDVERK